MGLTAKRIARLRKKRGRYLDGAGLLLQVKTPPFASWVLKYERKGADGKRVERMMGLGSLDVLTLKEAREKVRRLRQLLLDGVDPLDRKKADKAAQELVAARHITFEAAARQYFDQVEGGWNNPKHKAQFLASLELYAFDKLGRMAVADIATQDVLRVLENRGHENYPNQRLWDAIPETMSRVRGRIEQVLAWAAVRGYRTGENPARWKGHLSEALPARGKAKERGHHAALPYPELPGFMTELRARPGVAARALEFTVLTAARTSETLGATWEEIDLAAKLWTVPAARIKGGREHRVPLSDRVVEILKALPREEGNAFVFIGPRNRYLSKMAMALLLKRMNRDSITVHGFRSTFRDWAEERTNFPHSVTEGALAHTVGSKVERAYRRTDVFEKRRKLMAQWATYCGTAPAQRGQVVVMRGRG